MVTQATAAAAPAPCAGSAYRGLQSLVERSEAPSPVPVEVVAKSGAQAWLDAQPRSVGAWASALDWKGGDGEVLLVPAAEVRRRLAGAGARGRPGGLKWAAHAPRQLLPAPCEERMRRRRCCLVQGGVERVVLGAEDPTELWTYAALRSKLPPGQYQLAAAPDANAAALGWLLGGWQAGGARRVSAWAASGRWRAPAARVACCLTDAQPHACTALCRLPTCVPIAPQPRRRLHLRPIQVQEGGRRGRARRRCQGAAGVAGGR